MRFATPDAVMEYALNLARRGVGFVEPNPAVGAVVVDEHLQLLGEGWHEKFGGPHAEVHALAKAGEKARGATIYTTLEPCSHFGKTPPCADALIAAGIRHVETAVIDPAAHVSGQGIHKLRQAGITVNVGRCADKARELLAPFVAFQCANRPWVHAKWAMTLDGKISTKTGHSHWISSEASRRTVHELRGRVDAIVVGIGTVLVDDPQLNVRLPDDWKGPRRTPARIVLDSRLSISTHSQLVQTARKIPTIVATIGPEHLQMAEREADWQQRRQVLEAAGCQVWSLPCGSTDIGLAHHPCLIHLLEKIRAAGMAHLLVEGGARILGSFCDLDLIDEVHAYIAPKLVGGSAASSPIAGKGRMTIFEGEEFASGAFTTIDKDAYFHGVRRVAIDRLPWMNPVDA
ncbi:bifunctional diaminohydroxyphosphoribosylaminopyrimidine deaminase/5-amino-6-(5-phosphoribosylamino)uracil reductase RibD [Planctopirus hydrillae]|nr:bifunctional diaminohydroxyphosphoribosylaminopyrimidine deaminase/5-amino-6-(5-phosphoribosylamino)uracil reductase RibD [Planctopirus hydrillae]